MTLRLRYLGQTSVPVEIEGLTPDWACDKSLPEIERFEIFHGNRKLPLAELFAVAGDPSDRHWEFEGNLSGVHWLGAHMTQGRIDVCGPVGRHLGSEMRGGEIHVRGDAGGWVGAEMHGGLIHVRGHAGHLVGAAYRGSAKGMTGGTILVEGNAGNEIGLTMRRGLIAILGSAGDMVGFNMLAGTVLVFGDCGIRPGAGMRRGTIGLFGPNPPPLLPSFRYAATLSPTVLRLVLRSLQRLGMAFDPACLTDACHLYQGDFVALGKGEVWLRANASA
jgi:formylmethanofuran dehydrogenase subunit C